MPVSQLLSHVTYTRNHKKSPIVKLYILFLKNIIMPFLIKNVITALTQKI